MITLQKFILLSKLSTYLLQPLHPRYLLKTTLLSYSYNSFLMTKRYMMSGKGPKMPRNTSEPTNPNPPSTNPTSAEMIEAATTCRFPNPPTPTPNPAPQNLHSTPQPSQKASDNKQFQELKDANTQANKSLQDAQDHQDQSKKYLSQPSPEPSSPEPLPQPFQDQPPQNLPLSENQQLVNNMIASSIKATHSKTPTTLDSTQGLGAATQSTLNNSSKEIQNAASHESSGQQINSDSSPFVQIPTPLDSHPLMITDGSEFKETTIPATQMQQSHDFSDNIDSDVTEHLLASTAGLLPISPSLANYPHAVDSVFKVLDNEIMSKRHDPQTAKLVLDLIERDLVKLHGKNGCEGYRPNKAFRELWKKLFGKDVNFANIIFAESAIQTYLDNFSLEICVLSIDEINELNTVFLLPEQTHIGLYSVIDNLKIYWSYFTTDQSEKNVIISSYQPFGDDINKNARPQMLHVLVPQRIFDNNLMPLHSMTLNEAQTYLSDPEIQNKLKQLFIDNILPQLQNTTSDSIFVYEGIGVTKTQIEAVIEEFEKQQRELAENKFKRKYVQQLNLELKHAGKTDLEEWMNRTKEKTPRVYRYLAQLANEYNDQNNIDKRYEIPA